jgi:hypothetical protein
MSLVTHGPDGPRAAELVAASLITSDRGAELELIARDGQRLRLAADERTARALALGLWGAMERRRA